MSIRWVSIFLGTWHYAIRGFELKSSEQKGGPVLLATAWQGHAEMSRNLEPTFQPIFLLLDSVRPIIGTDRLIAILTPAESTIISANQPTFGIFSDNICHYTIFAKYRYRPKQKNPISVEHYF